jgi:hypothetical protein
MWTWRPFARTALGVFLLLHALAHTVLPLRGVLEYPPSTVQAAMTVAAYSLAVVTLFAAGIAMLGSSLLAPYLTRLVRTGLLSSIVALIAGWDPAAWWGLALDAALAGAFIAAGNTGVFASNEKRGTASRLRRIGRWLKEATAIALLAYVAVGIVLWPWHRRWGTTPAEWALSLPGDRVERNPRHELMHAVTIDAPADVIWSWLVQLGQDRAGFYSYDWIERVFLADVHNVYEIRPEWQQRAAGDFVRATPPNYLGGIFGQDVGWRVTYLDLERAMVLDHWGAFVLQPVGRDQTRFIIRSSIGGARAPVWGAGLTFALFELPHFIMERKMMLTIKACAENLPAVARLER